MKIVILHDKLRAKNSSISPEKKYPITSTMTPMQYKNTTSICNNISIITHVESKFLPFKITSLIFQLV